MPDFDKPDDNNDVNYLLDTLAAAAGDGQTVLVDSWFYNPMTMSDSALSSVGGARRPVKHFLAPRVKLVTDSDKELYEKSYVLTSGGILALAESATWDFERSARLSNRTSIWNDNNLFICENTSANTIKVISGYHGNALYIDGYVDLPINFIDAGSDEIEYFKIAGWIYLDHTVGDASITGPYGTTDMEFLASPNQYNITNTLFDGTVLSSVICDISYKWSQFYIYCSASGYTLDFKFVLNGETVSSYSVGSGLTDNMQALGSTRFTNCVIDEIITEAGNSAGSPSTIITDDQDIVVYTSSTVTGDSIFYDRPRERYLSIDVSEGTLMDIDNENSITVPAGYYLSSWQDAIQAPGSTIVAGSTAGGILSIKESVVALDASSIASPVTAGSSYPDGGVLVWVSDDNKFYESDDGISWNESDIPAISGASIIKLRIGTDDTVWALVTEGSPAEPFVYYYDGSSWTPAAAGSPIATIGNCYTIDSIGRSSIEIAGSVPIMIVDESDGSSDPGTHVYKWDDSLSSLVSFDITDVYGVDIAGINIYSLFSDGRFVYALCGLSGNILVYFTDGENWSFESSYASLDTPSYLAIASHRRANVNTWWR